MAQSSDGELTFQLTSSRRGWLLDSQNHEVRSHFNSHPHEEDDDVPESENEAGWIFQLTSSRRGWRIKWQINYRHKYFNSHPHEEDDQAYKIKLMRLIHFNSHPHEEDDNTFANETIPNTIFQLTSSRRGWQKVDVQFIETWNFNSHPHEEDDHNENKYSTVWNISTHILTKRMTAILNKNNLFKIAYYINNKHFISIVDIFFHFHIYF